MVHLLAVRRVRRDRLPPVVDDDEPRGRASRRQTRHAGLHPCRRDAVVERVPGAPPEHLRGGRHHFVHAQAERTHASRRGRHDRLRGLERGRRHGDAENRIGAGTRRPRVAGFGDEAQRSPVSSVSRRLAVVFVHFANRPFFFRPSPFSTSALLARRLGVQRVAAERRAEAVRGDEREKRDVGGSGFFFFPKTPSRGLLPRRSRGLGFAGRASAAALAAPDLQQQELGLRGNRTALAAAPRGCHPPQLAPRVGHEPARRRQARGDLDDVARDRIGSVRSRAPVRVLAQAQHADVRRVQVADELAGAVGAHSIVANGLELEPGRDPLQDGARSNAQHAVF